jgi:uncharacterized RmlC-like cupin family protein
MLRVSRVEEWLTRPRAGERDLSHPEPHSHGDCVIVRAGRDGTGTGTHPDISGASVGARPLSLHLVMMPPGTRGLPHHHRDHETAIYIVSGEAHVWHGPGLGQQSTVRSGDFLYIPPRTEHLAANRGEVTTIAVVARTDPAADASAVVIELPRHLADLVTLPVALQE